ncbi:LysR substrate-binding domain-containing protein [Trinickia sp. NRRL B-1857]|uniref:LysR substrate-binding domain-containing protein n=1 Tax=Trinickia sp. NRRL B-1857 TaxID=3162879 RepID=UPI003D2D2BBE
MRKLPSLNALRAFEAVARHMSMKLAAQELAVTATAVSHQVRQLEEAIGAPLFERRVRSLVLTPQGAALLPVLSQGFDAFESALATIAHASVRETVTISTTTALAACWLAPSIASFRAVCGEFDLRIHAADAAVTIPSEHADVAIRYGAGHWPGLVAERLFDDAYAPVWHPRLGLRDRGDLNAHALIHSEWQPSLRNVPDWGAWASAAGMKLATARELKFSDESHAIGAAIAGQGVALVDLPLIERELRKGELVAPFGPVLHRFSFWLVYPELATLGSGARKTAALCEWIRALPRPNVSALLGDGEQRHVH